MNLPNQSTPLTWTPTISYGPSGCPIHSLPNELVSEIMLNVVSPRPKADEDDLLDRLRFPLIAQSVCQRWWHVTRTTPALWAILYLRHSPENDFDRYIQRSGSVPLEVYLGSRLLGEEPLKLLDAIPALLPHSQRIWKLNIEGESAAQMHKAIRRWSVGLTNLRDLSIRAKYDSSGYPAQLNLSLPRLRSLLLSQYSLNWTNLPVSATLEELHITERSGHSVHITLFAATLQACTHLRVLELSSQVLTGRQNEMMEALQPFALERLEDLSLKQFYRHELMKIFNLIQTPRVRSLIVEGLSDNLWIQEDDVAIDSHKPLDLKFPVLETLTVERLDVSTEIVKMLPGVKHLTYMHNAFAEEHNHMDLEFGKLLTYWDHLPVPSPLETLKTRGVTLPHLITFFDGGTRKLFPLLRKLAISSQDIRPRGESSEDEFMTWENERRKLAALIELEVY